MFSASPLFLLFAKLSQVAKKVVTICTKVYCAHSVGTGHARCWVELVLVLVGMVFAQWGDT